jgi:pyruvate, water dikinase
VAEQSSIRWFETLGIKDVPVVGGKNASLGEMLRTLNQKGIKVPNGFATTSQAYWDFLQANCLDEKIADLIEELKKGKKSLEKVAEAIRHLILAGFFPSKISEEIFSAYRELSKKYRRNNVDVAVRSSATAEDLPSASFAGQQESFLNICGEKALLQACKRCYASLFTDRAIAYREAKRFDHLKIALSIGIQKMVRSDKGSAGVMFTLDTETGFPQVVVINASWGLGENVVQGAVTPDEYVVFKPLLGKKNVVPLIEKNLGYKEKKMVYRQGATSTVKNLTTTSKERARFVLSEK